MSRLDEIKERWRYFWGDEWSPFNQAITGHGARVFAPVLPNVKTIIQRDGWGPGSAIVVACVPDTAPLVFEAILHCPQDIKYLLDLLEESGYGQDEIVQGDDGSE